MKAKNLMMVLMIILNLVAIVGCTKNGNSEETKKLSNIEDSVLVTEESASQEKINSTYKKADLIEGIKKVNLGICDYMIRSSIVMLKDIEKELPVDNIRRYSNGFVVEYPMEDCEFLVITGNSGHVIGTIMKSYELHDKSEHKNIKKGMSISEVKKIFPEIVIDEDAEFTSCEVLFSDYTFEKIYFEKTKGKLTVSDTIDGIGISDEVIQSVKEAVTPNDAKREPAQAIVMSEGEVIKGRDKWDSFVNKTERGLTSDVLVKEYYTDEETDSHSVVSVERSIHYDGDKYTVKDSVCEIKDNNGKKETIYTDSTKEYKYLIEQSGRLPNAEVRQHGFYLVDDQDLTFEELQWSVFSSQSTDWIDYLQVFGEYIPYSELEDLGTITTLPSSIIW